MLEKIGLPPKPSMRGGSWVVDASHCQGCSSQFTFINRKHHCRRCGGIFCNGCTQQRMVLRGQGDSPVRICDPCKTIEEAARFELRYGHKNRALKGGVKQLSKHEESLIGDGKEESLSRNETHNDVLSHLNKSGSSGSTWEQSVTSFSKDVSRNSSQDVQDSYASSDLENSSPEQLRQRALDEKKKYKVLKGEGKSEEALQAFKRGKELEKQASAMELSLKKNQRIASRSLNPASTSETLEAFNFEEPDTKKKRVLLPKKALEEKDGLSAELRELGWSDADLRDTERNPTKLTLEGELLSLLGDVPSKPSEGKSSGSLDRSQVIAHKKQALLFKREGKLEEAKEELKKAKILEKQIEEQELLAVDNSGSDDELTALINSMEDNEQENMLLDDVHGAVDLNMILSAGDDLLDHRICEVTNDDMFDPEIAASLKSFGWSEDDDDEDQPSDSGPLRREELRSQVFGLKSEELKQKKVGNLSEAKDLLRKAKLLEKDANNSVSGSSSVLSQVSDSVLASEAENFPPKKQPQKSKLVLQRELLNIKKKALALRREGRFDEAEEELKKGEVLESQLEEMEQASKRSTSSVVVRKDHESTHTSGVSDGVFDLREDNELESQVTEQDMNDPALLSVLKDLGWQDDAVVTAQENKEKSKERRDQPVASVDNGNKRKSKAEVQKELLGIKRKALALRRQGKTEEAEEELAKAKVLEDQMAELEAATHANLVEVRSNVSGFVHHDTSSSSEASVNAPSKSKETATIDSKNECDGIDYTLGSSSTQNDGIVVGTMPSYQSEGFTKEPVRSESVRDSRSQAPVLANMYDGIHAEEDGSNKNEKFLSLETSSSPLIDCQGKMAVSSISFSGSELDVKDDLHVLKEKILVHKRKALALKREGKLMDAKEELRQAKLLEKSLEGLNNSVELVEKSQEENKGVSTEVAVNAQPFTLEGDAVTNRSEVGRTQKLASSRNRFKIQQESLAHKRKALKLRREGKIAESEAELELAKSLEIELEEIGGQSANPSGSTGKSGASEPSVEDLIDPQLMFALKSIGWRDDEIHGTSSQKGEPEKEVHDLIVEEPSLEEQIKKEKLRALELKRAGKQTEALEALRAAKRLEKKLTSTTL